MMHRLQCIPSKIVFETFFFFLGQEKVRKLCPLEAKRKHSMTQGETCHTLINYTLRQP